MENVYVTLKVNGFVTFELDSDDTLNIGKVLCASMEKPIKVLSDYADGELAIDEFEIVSVECD